MTSIYGEKTINNDDNDIQIYENDAVNFIGVK